MPLPSAEAVRLGQEVWDRLRAEDRQLLRELAALAGPQAQLALVGGAVRDALLGQTPLDLDITVAGADVTSLAAASGCPALLHPAFQNATLTLPNGRHADLIRARQESYPHPGQHPLTRPGNLTEDLQRRDFGLNALALLVPAREDPVVLDVVGGLDDLRQRFLRPLHARSFQDDASRLVRGARLAARLGLFAHPALLAQVPDALALADRTPRLWAELRLLLNEPRPGQAARCLRNWGAGELLGETPWLERLDRWRDEGQAVTAQTYAAALLAGSATPRRLSERLGLGERPAALLERAASDAAFAAGSPERTLRTLLYPERYEPLGGKDVLALGVPPGPGVGRALEHLARLRQAGELRSADDERRALHRYLSGKGSG